MVLKSLLKKINNANFGKFTVFLYFCVSFLMNSKIIERFKKEFKRFIIKILIYTQKDFKRAALRKLSYLLPRFKMQKLKQTLLIYSSKLWKPFPSETFF